MKVRNYTTLGYSCLLCGVARENTIKVFDCSGAAEFSVCCPVCGIEAVSITNRGSGSYEVALNCGFCGENHVYDVPIHTFWETEIVELTCPEHMNTVMAIGDTDTVREVISSWQDIIGFDLGDDFPIN